MAQTGITKISAATLAEKAKCSIRTITTTVKAIKQTNQIIVARLKSTKKNNGNYIFVDKKHANFKAILKEVFLLDDDVIAEKLPNKMLIKLPNRKTLQTLIQQA